MKQEWEKNRREMRWRNLNCGLKEEVFCRQHRRAMGPAIFLFGRLVAWQTKASGLVWGGHPFTYREIAHYMGESPRTVENWMKRLQKRNRSGGPYLRVKHSSYKHMIIYVLNPKKFQSAQKSLRFGEKSGARKPNQIPQLLRTSNPAKLRDKTKGLRDSTIEQKGNDSGRNQRNAVEAPDEPITDQERAEFQAELEKLRKKLSEPKPPKVSPIPFTVPDPQVPVFRSVEELHKWQESLPKPTRVPEASEAEQEVEPDEEAMELVLEGQD